MLEFVWGTVSSRKTADMLVKLHAYTINQHKKALLIKPSIDDRKGVARVWSRVPGLERDADLVLKPNDVVPMDVAVDALFVDEAQFLTSVQVHSLWLLSTRIPVFCYGLRTDFRGNLFDGSAALLSRANKITHLDSLCHFCGQLGTQNVRTVNGVVTFHGPQIQMGCEELFQPCCDACFVGYLKQ